MGQGVALKTTISREGENLGELEIWFDPDQIERALADRRSATILLAALQVLLSVVVLLAVLYRRLKRSFSGTTEDMASCSSE